MVYHVVSGTFSKVVKCQPAADSVSEFLGQQLALVFGLTSVNSEILLKGEDKYATVLGYLDECSVPKTDSDLGSYLIMDMITTLGTVQDIKPADISPSKFMEYAAPMGEYIAFQYWMDGSDRFPLVTSEVGGNYRNSFLDKTKPIFYPLDSSFRSISSINDRPEQTCDELFGCKGKFAKNTDEAIVSLVVDGEDSLVVTTVVDWLRTLYTDTTDANIQLWGTFSTQLAAGLLSGFKKISLLKDEAINQLKVSFAEQHPTYTGTFPAKCVTFELLARDHIAKDVSKKKKEGCSVQF